MSLALAIAAAGCAPKIADVSIADAGGGNEGGIGGAANGSVGGAGSSGGSGTTSASQGGTVSGAASGSQGAPVSSAASGSGSGSFAAADASGPSGPGGMSPGSTAGVASGSTKPSGSGGGLLPGSGPACPPQSTIVVGVKLTLQATWPSALAVTQGMGPVNIWLLSTYNIDSSNRITGTARTCSRQTPPITFNATGNQAVGAPSGSVAQEQVVIPSSTWNAPQMPASPVTGAIGGWSVGSSIAIDPSTATFGLSPNSKYADPSVAWPQQGAQIPTSDVVDGDGDGHPGITGLPRSDAQFYLPHVGVTSDTPQADQLYIVLRTEIALVGTSVSCSEQTGTADANLLDSHVIGCRRVDTMGDCMSADWQFIDSNSTVYQVMSGTFDAKVITASGSATCNDVLAQGYSN